VWEEKLAVCRNLAENEMEEDKFQGAELVA
jgi:hypothetical protein